jgi:arylsulfatase A-like enzyme
MKIVVIEASALHLGFLGCYGNDWVATPNLDRLAAEGIVFDQHIADWPEPMRARQHPLITGRCIGAELHLLPASHPLIHFHRATVIADLATWEPRQRPIQWHDGPSLAPPWWKLPRDLLMAYAEEGSNQPVMADPPIGLVRLDDVDLDRLQLTYASVVTYFDAKLGHFLDRLREQELFDHVLVCVTARCGFPLGEHGMVGLERAWLHEELVHVPLVIRLPGAEHAGLRVPALTQSVDLVTTFRDFLGEPPEPAHGRSLLPLIRGEIEQIRPYAVSGQRVGGSGEWLLRTPRRALLFPVQVPDADPPRRPQVYVKPDDRWEVNDIAARCEEEVQQLELTLRAFVEEASKPGPLDYPPLPAQTASALT